MAHIGLSQNTDSRKAGVEAARFAAAQLPGDPGSWALAFCGGRHDPAQVLSSIRGELGGMPVFGGASAGLVTNAALGYTGYECGVALFPSDLPMHGIVGADLRQGERLAGGEIGRALRERASKGDSVLLLYDNVRTTPPPVLYAGSELMEGIYGALEGMELTILGGGLVGDFTFFPTFVFDGSEVVTHRAVALILPRGLRPRTTIMHGCIPISSFLEITRIEGPVLYELDGRRATDIFIEMLGVADASVMGQDIPFLVTLGEKHGDPFAPFSEEQYVNRLIIGADLEAGSVTLFEADFKVGTRVQIMSRDNRVMVDSVEMQTAGLLRTIDDDRAELALYIDCAGRASGFSGSEVEEAGVVRRLIGDRMPLLGFYSGVEIAPFLGRSRPLDWTGVLTVFMRN